MQALNGEGRVCRRGGASVALSWHEVGVMRGQAMLCAVTNSGATQGKKTQRMVAGFEKPLPAKENEMAKRGKRKRFKSF